MGFLTPSEPRDTPARAHTDALKTAQDYRLWFIRWCFVFRLLLFGARRARRDFIFSRFQSQHGVGSQYATTSPLSRARIVFPSICTLTHVE